MGVPLEALEAIQEEVKRIMSARRILGDLLAPLRSLLPASLQARWEELQNFLAVK